VLQRTIRLFAIGVLKPIKAYWTIGEGVVEDEVEEGVDEWFQ